MIRYIHRYIIIRVQNYKTMLEENLTFQKRIKYKFNQIFSYFQIKKNAVIVLRTPTFPFIIFIFFRVQNFPIFYI